MIRRGASFIYDRNGLFFAMYIYNIINHFAVKQHRRARNVILRVRIMCKLTFSCAYDAKMYNINANALCTLGSKRQRMNDCGARRARTRQYARAVISI